MIRICKDSDINWTQNDRKMTLLLKITQNVILEDKYMEFVNISSNSSLYKNLRI